MLPWRSALPPAYRGAALSFSTRALVCTLHFMHTHATLIGISFLVSSSFSCASVKSHVQEVSQFMRNWAVTWGRFILRPESHFAKSHQDVKVPTSCILQVNTKKGQDAIYRTSGVIILRVKSQVQVSNPMYFAKCKFPTPI